MQRIKLKWAAITFVLLSGKVKCAESNLNFYSTFVIKPLYY